MKRYTHLISGIAVGAVIASVSGSESIPLLIIGGLFGIFPDFDLLFSGFGKRVHRSAASHSLLASIIFAAGWGLVLIAAADLSYLHWLDAMPLMPSILVVFLASFVHTMEDTLTFQGCKLLYPLSRRTFKGVVRYDDVAVNAILSIIAAVVALISLQTDLSMSLPLILSLGKL